MPSALHILIVDDEALARSRLRTLLGDCDAGHAVSEAAHAADALAAVRDSAATRPVDAVLLDIRMPGQDGLSLAHSLRMSPQPPAIVFVTAHADHAVSAFELDAVDYLTKPVRLERLQQALAKVQRLAAARQGRAAPPPLPGGEALVIQDRGRTERVPLADVLYLKSEQKYVTVRTGGRSYILDASLAELEARYPEHFLRVHRSTLVARRAMRALEKHYDAEEGEGWALRLHGLAELVAVSRRQVAAVRDVLAG